MMICKTFLDFKTENLTKKIFLLIKTSYSSHDHCYLKSSQAIITLKYSNNNNSIFQDKACFGLPNAGALRFEFRLTSLLVLQCAEPFKTAKGCSCACQAELPTMKSRTIKSSNLRYIDP